MKRIVALILLVCLSMTICGCGGRSGAAILCVYEGAAAAQALEREDGGISCALADTDKAVLQQLDSGACDYALVTQQGFAAEEIGTAQLEDVALGVFCMVSGVGAMSTWTVNTRIAVIGEAENWADQLAQQALTCALHGSVRYMLRDAAWMALKKGQVDVVMGLVSPQDPEMTKLLKKKKYQLLSMPEGLLNLRLPDASMKAYELSVGEQTAQTYALMGTLAVSDTAEESMTQRIMDAVRGAGLVSQLK